MLRHLELAGRFCPGEDILQEGHRRRAHRPRGRKNNGGENGVISRSVCYLLNDAMAAFLLFSRPQLRRDTVDPAREVRDSEVSDPTVTTKTSKIARSLVLEVISAII